MSASGQICRSASREGTAGKSYFAPIKQPAVVDQIQPFGGGRPDGSVRYSLSLMVKRCPAAAPPHPEDQNRLQGDLRQQPMRDCSMVSIGY